MNELNKNNPAYRKIVLDILHSEPMTNADFDWDMLTPDMPILQLIPQEAIDFIKNLITSPRYAGNPKYREKTIDQVMGQFGFTHYAGGTNRLVYTHPATPRMIFKVALDGIGIKDNPAEFYNQKFLKPFCTKVFECSPCGTIASFQKVHPIMSKLEFDSVYNDYYRLIWYNIIGKFVMDDIGDNFFKNFGIWDNHFVVILDFPYMYELDGSKLYCNAILDNGSRCHGEIDYSPGFIELVCTKCGRKYRAGDLAKSPENRGVLIRREGGARMKINLKRGNEVIKSFDTTKSVEYLSKENVSKKNNKFSKSNGIKVKITKIKSTTNENIKDKNVEIENNTDNTNVDNNETKKDTMVERVIKLSIGNKSESSQINRNIDDGNEIKINVTRNNKKTITVPKSTIEKLSRPVETSVPKEVENINTDTMDSIKEEEKEDISKEISTPDTMVEQNTKAEIIEPNDSNIKNIDSSDENNEEEDDEEENTTMIVFFVKDLPLDNTKNFLENFTEDINGVFFAKYKGTDDFESETKYLNYPIVLDSDKYDLYFLMENGKFYRVYEYKEDGTPVLDTKDYVEENLEKENDDTNKDITDEDIINILKASGKYTIEEVMNKEESES